MTGYFRLHENRVLITHAQIPRNAGKSVEKNRFNYSEQTLLKTYKKIIAINAKMYFYNIYNIYI